MSKHAPAQIAANLQRHARHLVALQFLTILSMLAVLLLATNSGIGHLAIGITLLITMPLFISAFVVYLMWLHACWLFLNPRGARVSPNSAWILMMVPLFNVAWQFVALLGLARELNRQPEVREGLVGSAALAPVMLFCVLSAVKVFTSGSPGADGLVLVLLMLAFPAAVRTITSTIDSIAQVSPHAPIIRPHADLA